LKNWYTCGACGDWFQARIEAERSPGCDAVRDRVAMADALAEFDQRFEQTNAAFESGFQQGERRGVSPTCTLRNTSG